jgi:hypothetical protein
VRVLNNMSFSLPSSNDKRYLTGADWIINMIDHTNKRATGSGNQSQVVIELASDPSPDKLSERFNSFLEKYPIVNGKIHRDYVNLAPYWKFDKESTYSPKLEVHYFDSGDAYQKMMKVLEETVNRPFEDDTQHLKFTLVSAKSKYYFVMTFDHRLLDARGAEAFLNMFQLEQEEPGEHCNKVSVTEPAHLDEWKKQFEAGRDTSRALRAIAENRNPILPLSKGGNKRFKFEILSFDKEETSRIVKKAYSQAGYLLIMPYILAVAVQAIHKAFRRKDIQAGDYIIPVSTDMREKDQLPEKTFFNYVSFFIFRLSQEKADDFAGILDEIKMQMYDQVKSGSLKNFNNASHLLRIVPLSILGPLMRVLKQWPSGSFCSSYVGENTYKCSKFMNEDVVNIYHMPRPPVPPGIGIYFNQYRGKLNATLSYMDGMLDEKEIECIVSDIKSGLNL